MTCSTVTFSSNSLNCALLPVAEFHGILKAVLHALCCTVHPLFSLACICQLGMLCESLCRPTHKQECKQKAQLQLRVNISSKPPGGGPGASNNWVGVSQSDIRSWGSGQINGTNSHKYPEPKKMTGSVDVNHEKLFDVKIQVTTQSCMWFMYCNGHAWSSGSTSRS